MDREQVCCKCGEKGRISHFETPDHTGVIAMFEHKTGKMIETKDFFGNKRYIEETKRCFVTKDELNKTTWYKGWFEELTQIREKYWKEQKEKDDKYFQEQLM